MLDVHLPDMSGTEVAREIASGAPHIPVIGLTMDSSPETAQAMLAAGAVICLKKDGLAAELIQAIHEAKVAGAASVA